MNSLKHKKKILSIVWNMQESNFFSICVDVYKIYEVNDFEKIYEVLSTLKYKKVKVNNTLIDIYKEMLLNHIFEQNKNSITSTGILKIAHNSFSIMKWICYCDRSYYENIKYYDLMGGMCKYLNETSKRWILRWSKGSSIKKFIQPKILF